jgi:hypothetical protein
MKSIQLLKEAANILAAPGDIEPQVRETLSNDIHLFFDDQERRAANALVESNIRVSTDGENWEYTDNVHVVSRISQAGSDEVKEFSITMNAENMSLQMKSSIHTESPAGNIAIDYVALSGLGFNNPAE